MRTIENGNKSECEYEGCDKVATEIAAHESTGRVGVFCLDHARIVADARDFTTVCPNCDCLFGID